MKQTKLLKPIWRAAMLLLLFALPFSASAYDFMVNGLAYNYNSDGTSVTVTYKNSSSNNYSGLTTANIPSSVTINGTTYSVTSIGSYAFYDCSGLTCVTIPNSVTSIGEWAFYERSGLTMVESLIENPTSVSMGYDVFGGINSNCILKVPNGTISAYRQADQWKDFKHIIDDTFDPTQQIAFEDAEVERICVNNWDTNGDGYLSYTEAANVTSIRGVFGSNETIVSFNELQYFVGITSIGDEAFWGCSGLTSIIIPNSVTTIGYYAFLECRGLTSVIIPNSVTSICAIAFCGCTGLTSVTIPNSVTSIGSGAFDGCSGLESMVVESGNSAYDSRNNCNAIIETASNTLIAGCKNTTIPNSVTSIGESAFIYCSGLTSITIPNSVTSIGSSAFAGCSGLTSVTLTGTGAWNPKSNMPSINQIKTVNIGSGITSLGNFGFVPDVVNCYAEVPPTCSSNTFSNYDGELHVPTAATVAYMTADYWQNFTNLNNDITEKVTLNLSSAALIQHEELQLTATVKPNGSTLVWSSTNPAVAMVDNNGKVTALDQGECDIYATLATNPAVYASCHITAIYPEITSLTLNETNLQLNNVADTFTLIVTTTPANSGPKPTWYSSDETIATVDANGLVTAINQGECDITVMVLDKSATCHVTVTSAIVITLDMASVTIAPNEIITLTPSFNPVETDIVATSSDANVAFARAIIQNGVKKVQVVGLAEGTATITVASVDGKAIPATCVVTVAEQPTVILGDANGDGTVNVSDYVYVANYILEQNPDPFVFAAADVDGNGEINVSDLVLVANITLTYEGAPMLNAPAPSATQEANINMNVTTSRNGDGTTSLTVGLDNSIALTALQMDISLPQGLTVTGATLTDRAARNHQVEVAELANGNHRLLLASGTSKAFKGSEGALLTLTLSGEPQSTVTLSDIRLASPDGRGYTLNDILLSPVVTGVNEIAAKIRIYGEAGNIVIESPVNGTAQLVMPNGMSQTVKVTAGRNIYPAPSSGLVIVRMNTVVAKLLF